MQNMQKRKHARHAKKDQIKAKIKKIKNQKVFQRIYEKECRSPKSPKSRNSKNAKYAKMQKMSKMQKMQKM